MKPYRRTSLTTTASLAAATRFTPAIAQTKRLRFGVGSLLPNLQDTKKAFAPVFAHLAKALGTEFDLVATTA
jgi:phosphonate transport system substrate-binding protein